MPPHSPPPRFAKALKYPNKLFEAMPFVCELYFFSFVLIFRGFHDSLSAS